MKWVFRSFLFLIFPFFVTLSKAQVSIGGIPESFAMKTKQAVVLPTRNLKLMDTAALVKEDKLYGIDNRYSIAEDLNIDIKNKGVKTEIAGKGFIWRYQVQSQGTYSLGIFFSTYYIPEGASVFVYDQTHTRLLGAFTSLNNKPSGQLSVAEFASQNAIIEYFEPYNSSFGGQLIIGSVSQSYKDIYSIMASVARIGINCPEGANWQDQKHAVCRMTFRDGGYGYYCTGFLVNNVRQDGTPFFMTASHCISSNTVAATLVTYFNYENSDCSSTDAMANQTLSGATLNATNSASDFTLLNLDEVPPSAYKAYLAGWDASSRSPLNGTCIHHPSGTPKCISIDNNAPTTYSGSISWDNGSVSQANSHWLVKFDLGSTESGSSGSPLFDDNKRVIGQLHGGDDISSYYGKFSVSWNSGSYASKQLKNWLDPDNTGKTFINGVYLNSKPKAAFSVAYPQACVNNVVQLTDQSLYSPTQWKWKIAPASFQFVNGTGETSRNPQVVFTNAGTYSFSLITRNDYGTDSVVKSDYIEVVDSIRVSLSGFPADTLVCGCNLIKFPIVASGAPSYTFSLEKTNKIGYSTSSDSIYLTMKEPEKKNGSFETKLWVTGKLGSCIASDSIRLKVSMPPNDNIANAIRLWPGDNGTFSNFCGSVEENEPHPALLNCTGNDSWCKSNSGRALNNSMWFTFLGPSNGKVTIDTRNINDRIAVYEADYFSDIISGNSLAYKIIAANDNRSDNETSASLENLSVVPYKTYWLQVDGFDGASGDIAIKISSKSLEVLSNPSRGKFDLIISCSNEGEACVKVFNTTGALVLSQNVNVSAISNRFNVDISSLPNGLYFVYVNVGGESARSKVVKAD